MEATFTAPPLKPVRFCAGVVNAVVKEQTMSFRIDGLQ
jgi:hypothetical protein